MRPVTQKNHPYHWRTNDLYNQTHMDLDMGLSYEVAEVDPLVTSFEVPIKDTAINSGVQ